MRRSQSAAKARPVVAMAEGELFHVGTDGAGLHAYGAPEGQIGRRFAEMKAPLAGAQTNEIDSSTCANLSGTVAFG